MSMDIERRVMWLEGAFLRPQHFQQQDRRFSSALAERARMAQPFCWGFSTLEIDEGALRRGAVALRRCTGVFGDGEPFAWPGEIAAPPSVEPARSCIGETVYLVAPRLAGGALMGAPKGPDGAAAGARYVIEGTLTADALAPGGEAEMIETGTSDARLVVGEEAVGNRLSLPVARVREVTTDNVVLLDPDFIPTVTNAGAAPALEAIVREIASLLAARADTLSGDDTRIGAASNAALVELMLLRIVNGKGALFAELRDARAHHPETLFRECVSLAGELYAFRTSGSRRAPAFPPYDHDDIMACFGPVVAAIRSVLAEVVEVDAYPIRLKWSERGGYFGPISPPDLLPDGQFVVVARASTDDQSFRATFPGQTTIASSNEVMGYVNAASRGARLTPLNMPPPELRPMAGWTYFEITHDAEPWKDIAASRSIAIYVADEFPNLQLELWAIRTAR